MTDEELETTEDPAEVLKAANRAAGVPEEQSAPAPEGITATEESAAIQSVVEEPKPKKVARKEAKG